MNGLMDQLLKLPLSEKLHILEALWEDIATTKEPVGIPEEHREEMRRRAAEFSADSSIAITEKDLWERLERENG